MVRKIGLVSKDIDIASMVADLSLDNTTGGTDGEVNKAPTSNVMYDHGVATTGVHGVGTGTVGSVSIADKTIYVNNEATGAGDGTSMADGFTTIQAAVDSLEDVILHAYTIKKRDGTRYTGTADSDVANKLHDVGVFVASVTWAGRRVWNKTDNTWGVIGARESDDQVTTIDSAGTALDLFDTGNEDYVIFATPYRETVYLNSNPTVNPSHQILGRLNIQGEYYWYGTCQAIGGLAGDLIANCDTAWTDASGGDVTCTADTTIFLTGTKSAKMVVAAGAGVESLAYFNTGALDISSVYTHISFWFYSTVALNASDLEFVIDEQTNLAMGATHEHLAIPAITANTWTKVSLAIGTPSDFNTLNSIGIRQLVDKGDMTIYVDDVKASVPGSFKLAAGSDMTGVAVGDKVYLIDASGKSSTTPIDYFVSTVDDISGVASLILGTPETTKNPSSTWRYAVRKTELSASDDGYTKTRSNCIKLTGIDNVYINGLYFTLSSVYAIHATNSRNIYIYGGYFDSCTYCIQSTSASSVTPSYSYMNCNASSSIGIVIAANSYAYMEYCATNVGTTGTTYSVYPYRGSVAVLTNCYLTNADYGVRVADHGFANVSATGITSSVTYGLYANEASFIKTSGSIINNATTPKTPAAATDPAWVT